MGWLLVVHRVAHNHSAEDPDAHDVNPAGVKSNSEELNCELMMFCTTTAKAMVMASPKPSALR
jgi:hypothetical protein